MKLVVAFICYNQSTAKYLAHFLPSLKKALQFLDTNKYQIMAYDNSDSDENINRLALEFFSYQEKIEIKYYSGKYNIGFGSAYNYLIKKAKDISADYFLLINPDTVVEEDAIFKLVKALDKDQKLTAVCPKILRWDFANLKQTEQIDSCGLILKPGLRFLDLGQGEIDNGQHDNSEIIGPSGAVAMLVLNKLKKIAKRDIYFDPRFFMYKEDCDLAYRMYKAGHKTKLQSDAIVYHDRSAAFYGQGLVARFANYRQKSNFINEQSFYGQHLLFRKFFSQESLISQVIILGRVFAYFIYSLIFKQKNLKSYINIFKKEPLTNIK